MNQPKSFLTFTQQSNESPLTAKFVYENLPSNRLIDRNLAAGNLVGVRIRFPNGVTHCVVVCGKDGFDYLIRDPSRFGAEKGVYPLKKFGSDIESARFYQKL